MRSLSIRHMYWKRILNQTMCAYAQQHIFFTFYFFKVAIYLIPPFFSSLHIIYQSFFTWWILVLWTFNMSQRSSCYCCRRTNMQWKKGERTKRNQQSLFFLFLSLSFPFLFIYELAACECAIHDLVLDRTMEMRTLLKTFSIWYHIVQRQHQPTVQYFNDRRARPIQFFLVVSLLRFHQITWINGILICAAHQLPSVLESTGWCLPFVPYDSTNLYLFLHYFLTTVKNPTGLFYFENHISLTISAICEFNIKLCHFVEVTINFNSLQNEIKTGVRYNCSWFCIE